MAWSLYDFSLTVSDGTKPTGNSVKSSVALLWAAGIEPLLVQWSPCDQVNLTTFDPNVGFAYWGERWELYKQQARSPPARSARA